MVIRSFFVLFFVLINTPGQTQNPWFKAVSCSDRLLGDRAFIQTNEKEFFHAFVSDSEKLGLALLDSSGNYLWNKITRIQTSSQNMDIFPVVELPGKQFLIALKSNPNLLRIDSLGNYLKSYQLTTNPANTTITDIRKLSDSTLLIALFNPTTNFILITDTALNVLSAFETSGWAKNILHLNNGNYILSGSASDSSGNAGTWILLCDANFSIIWSRMITTTCDAMGIKSVREKNGFLYLLSPCSEWNDVDNLIGKIDLLTGNVQWLKRLHHTNAEIMWLFKTGDGSMHLLGRNGYIMPIDTAGTFSQPYYLPLNTDYIYDFENDEALVVPGSVRSNQMINGIIRTDSLGHISCLEQPDTILSYTLSNEPFSTMSFGTLTPYTTSFVQGFLSPDYYQYSFSTSDGCAFVKTEEKMNEKFLEIYPNPADGFLSLQWIKRSQEKLELRIYDQTGKLCLKSISTENNDNLSLSTTELEPGVYILAIQNESSFIERKNFVVMHN